MTKTFLTILLLFIGSIGYQPDDPPTVRLSLRDGTTLSEVRLLELRDDSVWTNQEKWITLSDIMTLQEIEEFREGAGFFVGCLAGGGISILVARLLVENSTGNLKQNTPLICGTMIAGAGVGGLAGKHLMLMPEHPFNTYSAERRREVIRKLFDHDR